MGRSIAVLTIILILVLILTQQILKNPISSEEEDPTLKYGTTLSLSTYRYNDDFGISSETEPEYTIDSFLQRGYEFQRRGNAKKAEDIFKTALLFDADNPEITKAVGEMAFVDGRFHEACNYFAQYLSRRPDRVESYTNLSIAFICAENLSAAEATVEKGLTRIGDAEPGPFYFIRACIEQQKGDIVKADRYLRQAYDELGSEMFKLVNSQWSASIQELAFYKHIAPLWPVQEATISAPPEPAADALDVK